MPLIWRYLLRNFFQTFLLCILGFITVNLVLSFKDLAKFAASGPSLFNVLLFISFQIPLTLHLAIPASCLISSILFFQKMSRTQELTALRSSGLTLFQISYPLLLTGLVMSFINFAITAEISPRCRYSSKTLIFNLIENNPLIIFNKHSMVSMADMFIDLKNYKSSQSAKDAIIVTLNHSTEHLALLTAKEFSIKENFLIGKNVSFASTITSKGSNGYDHLLIENQQEMSTKSVNITKHMHSTTWQKGNGYLTIKQLLAKFKSDNKSYKTRKESPVTAIAYRTWYSMTPLAFTLIGISYGIEISRRKSFKSSLYAFLLSAGLILSFFSVKSASSSVAKTTLIYLSPFIVISIFCLRNMYKKSKGIE